MRHVSYLHTRVNMRVLSFFWGWWSSRSEMVTSWKDQRQTPDNEEAWLPLVDKNNEKLFPELEERLSKTVRNGPLIVMNDGSDRGGDVVKPWRLNWFRHRVKQVIEHANLPRDLTFTSFRHGGFTEAGDAEVSEAGIRALGQRKTTAMQSLYVKRTERQRQNAMTNRRNERVNK